MVKLLFYPELAALTSVMTGRDVGDVIIDGRLEAYSLKETRDERKGESRAVAERLARDAEAAAASAASDRLQLAAAASIMYQRSAASRGGSGAVTPASVESVVGQAHGPGSGAASAPAAAALEWSPAVTHAVPGGPVPPLLAVRSRSSSVGSLSSVPVTALESAFEGEGASMAPFLASKVNPTTIFALTKRAAIGAGATSEQPVVLAIPSAASTPAMVTLPAFAGPRSRSGGGAARTRTSSVTGADPTAPPPTAGPPLGGPSRSRSSSSGGGDDGRGGASPLLRSRSASVAHSVEGLSVLDGDAGVGLWAGLASMLRPSTLAKIGAGGLAMLRRESVLSHSSLGAATSSLGGGAGTTGGIADAGAASRHPFALGVGGVDESAAGARSRAPVADVGKGAAGSAAARASLSAGGLGGGAPPSHAAAPVAGSSSSAGPAKQPTPADAAAHRVGEGGVARQSSGMLPPRGLSVASGPGFGPPSLLAKATSTAARTSTSTTVTASGHVPTSQGQGGGTGAVDRGAMLGVRVWRMLPRSFAVPASSSITVQALAAVAGAPVTAVASSSLPALERGSSIGDGAGAAGQAPPPAATVGPVHPLPGAALPAFPSSASVAMAVHDAAVEARLFASLLSLLETAFPDYTFRNLPITAIVEHPSISAVQHAINAQLQPLAERERAEPRLATELQAALAAVERHPLSRVLKEAAGVAAREPASKAAPAAAPAGASAATRQRGDATSGDSVTEEPAPPPVKRARRQMQVEAGVGAGAAATAAASASDAASAVSHGDGAAEAGRSGAPAVGGGEALAVPEPVSGRTTSEVDGGGSLAPLHHALGKGGAGGHGSIFSGLTGGLGGARSTFGGSLALSHVPDSRQGFVRERFREVEGGYGAGFLDALWTIVDDVVGLDGTDAYSYRLEEDEDPLMTGALWSFNYLLVNRQRRKVVFFAVTARSALSSRAAFVPFSPASSRAAMGTAHSPSPSPLSSPLGGDDSASQVSAASAASPSHVDTAALGPSRWRAPARGGAVTVAGRKRRRLGGAALLSPVAEGVEGGGESWDELDDAGGGVDGGPHAVLQASAKVGGNRRRPSRRSSRDEDDTMELLNVVGVAGYSVPVPQPIGAWSFVEQGDSDRLAVGGGVAVAAPIMLRATGSHASTRAPARADEDDGEGGSSESLRGRGRHAKGRGSLA